MTAERRSAEFGFEQLMERFQFLGSADDSRGIPLPDHTSVDADHIGDRPRRDAIVLRVLAVLIPQHRMFDSLSLHVASYDVELFVFAAVDFDDNQTLLDVFVMPTDQMASQRCAILSEVEFQPYHAALQLLQCQ